MRKIKFEEKFIHLLKHVKYVFAQDQDYFNRICKGRIKYLNECWNACGNLYNKSNPKIIYYTVYKSWQSIDMPNSNYFWNVAKKTVFYNYICGLHNEESKMKGDKSLREFRRIAKQEADCVGNG